VDGCPDRAAVTWSPNRNNAAGAEVPRKVIIEALDFVTDAVVIRNVSGGDLVLDGWDVMVGGDQRAHPDYPEETVLPAGERLVYHTRGDEAGNECELYSGAGAGSYDLRPAEGEVTIRSLDTDGSTMNIDGLEAFVRWGNDRQYGSMHRDEADTAGLWSDVAGQFVVTTEQTVGVVAIGDVSAPEGWAAPDVECFGIAAPAN